MDKVGKMETVGKVQLMEQSLFLQYRGPTLFAQGGRRCSSRVGPLLNKSSWYLSKASASFLVFHIRLWVLYTIETVRCSVQVSWSSTKVLLHPISVPGIQ